MKDYTAKEYFASANSYSGFKSYFNEIFDSENYTAVYILKGGPGTGKSTIMKKLSSYATSNNLFSEIFRCSSDPASLDGVIIENQTARVAILDGTAPHVRDADIPGAIDELINLGVAWNASMLKPHRERIIELNRNKSQAYTSAYGYLQKSFIYDTNIKAEISKIFDFEKCRKECSSILESFTNIKKGCCSTRLISSFSKFGYCTLSKKFEDVNRKYYVPGVCGSNNLFLSCMVDVAKRMGIDAYVFPSALDSSSYEGIYFKNEEILISVIEDANILYDSTELLKTDDYISIEKNLKPLVDTKNYYLSLAANSLAEASSHHFKLEEIYTPCMNFGIINEIYENLLLKIKNIFQTDV